MPVKRAYVFKIEISICEKPIATQNKLHKPVKQNRTVQNYLFLSLKAKILFQLFHGVLYDKIKCFIYIISERNTGL